MIDEMLKIQKKFQDEHFPVDRIKFSEIASAISSEAQEVWHDSDGRWWKSAPKFRCGDCGALLTEDEVNCVIATNDIAYTGILVPENLICSRCGLGLENMETIEEHLKEESTDILHFLLLLWLKLGMTGEEILNAYKKKMGVNQERQRKGY